MAARIERDWARFRDIVRGKIRQNLRQFIANRQIIGRQGRTVVTIPIPQIELPHFTYRWDKVGGVGQGEGEEGDLLWTEGNGEGARTGPGFGPGWHTIEVEVTLEEMVDLLGEELELPSLKPKSAGTLEAVYYRYRSIRRVGPECLRHMRRTYREALKRQLISGTYDYQDPKVTPVRRDFRYRAPVPTSLPESKAALFFILDVSGSMGDRQKELVRTTAFWIDQWIRKQYKGVEHRYIVHDAVAREVRPEFFYRIKESGGTKISSAYALCDRIITADYGSDDWNLFAFHFTDGDNWEEDDRIALEILEQRLVPQLNLFGYGQVQSPWGTGRFIRQLRDAVKDRTNVRTTHIVSEDDILDAIKDLLGKREDGKPDEVDLR